MPAAALGSRLLHPGMILLVFEDAKGREGPGRGERLFSPNVVFFPCVKIWLNWKKKKRDREKNMRIILKLEVLLVGEHC